LFTKKSPPKAEASKAQLTSVETALEKLNLHDVWRQKMEGENKKLLDKLSALETLFQESLKASQEAEQTRLQEVETRNLQLEMALEEKRNLVQGMDNASFSQHPGGGVNGDSQEKHALESHRGLIQKFSLNLAEIPHSKLPKTVDTTIPAGAFAKTVLLSGLDASASMSASSDPRPMLLRMIDHGTLPRRFQSDLKDCHCTASAFGDLSSERIYARLEKLTCIERKTGEIIETQVAGYIAGPDGKAGIRGIVASKDGQFLGRSLVGGIFSGLSNVANPQNRQTQAVNPFVPGGKQPSPPDIGDMFTAGMSSGVSTALDRLSQYYIDRAEQLQPVIQVSAGQVVDIVFTEGTAFGSVAEIRNQRPESSVADAR
jgi:conjugal transfer pilus assembly protein TraB